MLDISGGQGLTQFGELGLAFVLSALIGLEREFRQKAAGLRTHTLVGVSAALFMLISKYGFSDVLGSGRIILDPSRVAAQIVSGIGFLGAGIIFVRRDVVRGLTTAAVVWFVAAIGMACGGGLAGLAIAVTALYFVALYALPALVRLLPVAGASPFTLRLEYRDGQGVLRRALEACTALRFRVAEVTIMSEDALDQRDRVSGARLVSVELVLHGNGQPSELAARLNELPGVLTVRTGDPEAAT
jgi:putative Mg2+ transporter-C (MgtC) family protein